MTPETLAWLLAVTGASKIVETQKIQNLWSGYGELLRVILPEHSVIFKSIKWPEQSHHPRGWNTDLGHQRKLTSYKVELHWYSQYATSHTYRTAQYLGHRQHETGFDLVLEDLNPAGYHLRYSSPPLKQITWGLQWLAAFHAHHLHSKAEGLWKTGTYWHLETRPEEYERMAEGPIKAAAHDIDQLLLQARYQTLVHGDAKVANFCFSDTGVAAVDFQYIGQGVGIKDVAYFLGSCLDENACFEHEEALLKAYFEALKSHLPAQVYEPVFQEWSQLYPVAWTDFYRFLLGWSPGHQKVHDYTRFLAEKTLEMLQKPRT